jgi:hypothetical protein
MRRALPFLIVLALAACGPAPPQAPFRYAKKLDSATSDISTACGEAAQVSAFEGNNHADLAGIKGAAARSARKLAAVYRRNPAWIYQGETIEQIVSDAHSMLSSCGLKAAATELRRGTARR